VQALEAARSFEEGVVTDPREADVGSILGFGFAPYSGGALSYIEFLGARNFVEVCRKLEGKHGARFAPPRILVEMASSGGSFYGREREKAAA
jgi:3-hydroxyacyl-CoA dehydrogenase/enoyl-CoA hydratase/3-hydroxybutyryl-CoA epimerase